MSTPVTTWNTTTINGRQYLVVDVASFRIPLDWDPSSNMFIAVAVPSGGWGNLPVLLKGDPGDPATLDSTINVTELAYNDPTPASGSLTPLGGNEYQANLVTHAGQPGPPGNTTLDPTDFGAAVFGKIIVVNSAANGFTYSTQLVGDRFAPTIINSTPAGNPLYTLCAASIPAQLFDWRPEPAGQTIFTKTGFGNCHVDLIARLNDESGGNIVGRGFGNLDNSKTATVISDGPPPASADAYDRVAAGAAAVVYLRAERQTGTDTFTTSNATTWFGVKVRPIPGTGILG